MSMRGGRLPSVIRVGRATYTKVYALPPAGRFTGRKAEFIITGLELLLSSGLLNEEDQKFVERLRKVV